MITKKCAIGAIETSNKLKIPEDTMGLTYEQQLSLFKYLRDDKLFWKAERLAADTNNDFVKKAIHVKQLARDSSLKITAIKIIEITKNQKSYDEFIATYSRNETHNETKSTQKKNVEPILPVLTKLQKTDEKSELTSRREQAFKGDFSLEWEKQLTDIQCRTNYHRRKLSVSFFTRKPQKSNEQNLIDANYYDFISGLDGFKYLKEDKNWHKAQLHDDIKQAFEECKTMGIDLKDGFDINAELPPGNYACINEGFFAPVRLPDLNETPVQGWKIHITAHPHSAQKIAALILSQMDTHIELAGNTDKGVPAKYTFFKIIHEIPLMRTLFYIFGNLKGEGKETQAGKFITIYPSTRAHAAALAKALDNVLVYAIKGGILTKKDFYPCVGDALVGESGGVYVRYGNLTRHNNRVQPTRYNKMSRTMPNSMTRHHLDSCISLEVSAQPIQDDRRYPWPDFMNNKKSWELADDPFPGLNLRWYPSPDMQPITWENRPDSWSTLNSLNHNASSAVIARSVSDEAIQRL